MAIALDRRLVRLSRHLSKNINWRGDFRDVRQQTAVFFDDRYPYFSTHANIDTLNPWWKLHGFAVVIKIEMSLGNSTILYHKTIITRCAYAQGRVKRLSPSIYLFVCVCVCGCVCRQKTRLFAVLPLENRHEIALYRSASQFIFFERCLESRTSLLSSAMAMGF